MGNDLYKNHVIAYIDILGFEDMIREAGADSERIYNIYNLLNEAKKFVNIKSELKMRMFSDTVIISNIWTNELSLQDIIQIVMIFQGHMATKASAFFRGAISFGNHHQMDDVIFGPAIIEAYKIEKIASWPRVILAPSLIKKAPKSFFNNNPYILTDNGGVKYLDYLSFLFASLTFLSYTNKQPIFATSSQIFGQHKDSILKAIKKVVAKPEVDIKILSRYHELATYHNGVVDDICNNPFDAYADKETGMIAAYCHSAASLFMFMEKILESSSQTFQSFMGQHESELSNLKIELNKNRIDTKAIFKEIL